MGMRIVPLLVAGIVGLLIGWLLGPNIDEVRDEVAARLDAQAPQIAALQSGLAGIEQRIAAAPTPDAAVAALTQRLDALQASVAGQADAVASRVQEQSSALQEQARGGLETMSGAVQEQLTALESQTAAISANVDRLLSAPAAPEPQPGGDAAALAGEIGATGAVLLPGQGALFGGGRLDLVSIDAEGGTAVLRANAGAETPIENGATFDVAENCTIRLAGVAAGAAYLMPEECAEPTEAEGTATPAAAPAATPAPAPAATPAPAPAPAPAPEPSTEGTNPAPAGQPAAQDAEAGSDVPAQGAQAVPNQQPGMASGNAGAQPQTDRPAAVGGTAPAQ